MSNHKTLALVGAGHWGKNLARNFYALGALHTLCDTRPELLQTYASEYPGVRLTGSYQQILDDPAVGQVAIAAPAPLHYALAKAALLAGKDVYVEKPLCLKSEEAEELVQLADARKKILMVGHLLQYHPAVAALQALAAAGKLGKVQYIASHRLSLGVVRTEENNLWSFAPHDISVILSLMGGILPTGVRSIGQQCLSPGIPDMAVTTLEFPHGARAHIYTSWLHPFKEQKLTLVGSEGMAVFDDTKPWEEKLLYYRLPITWNNGTVPQAQKTEGEKIPLAQNEPLREECSHFLRCCQERIQPKTDGKEGLKVLRVLQAAQESLDAGGEKRAPASVQGSFYAHSTAIIDAGAVVGAGTKVWHFSHIMDKATLGARCNIGQNVVVSPGVTLGANVKVQNNVSIYSGVVCEDDVFLGPSMVFTNVNNPRSAVNRRGEYQTTIVRRGATIGANATIVCGTELGAHSFIGAGAVVTKDVKPYALMVGNPARQVGWMSRHGERLELPVSIGAAEEKRAACPATGEVYILRGSQLELEAQHEACAQGCAAR